MEDAVPVWYIHAQDGVQRRASRLALIKLTSGNSWIDLLYHFSIHCRVKVTREDSGLVTGTSPLSRLHDGMMHGDKLLEGFTRGDLLHTEK